MRETRGLECVVDVGEWFPATGEEVGDQILVRERILVNTRRSPEEMSGDNNLVTVLRRRINLTHSISSAKRGEGVHTTSPELMSPYGRGESEVIWGGEDRQIGCTIGVWAQFSGILWDFGSLVENPTYFNR